MLYLSLCTGRSKCNHLTMPGIRQMGILREVNETLKLLKIQLCLFLLGLFNIVNLVSLSHGDITTSDSYSHEIVWHLQYMTGNAVRAMWKLTTSYFSIMTGKR